MVATREERTAKTTELLASVSLVALSGSDKQISWAEKIRATKLEHVANCLAVETLSARHPDEVAFLSRCLSHLATIGDSGWWIQLRDCTDLDNPEWWTRERKYPIK